MTSAIDLNPNHLDIVERILAEHVPGCEVRAFGSRAAWTARDYSDVDLAVVGDGPLHWRTLSRLREAFEESRLPMRVDVLDWHAISEGFREAIKSDCVVVQKAAVPAVWRDVLLGDYASLTKGLSYKSAFLNEDGPDLLGLGQFAPGGGAKLDGGRTYSGEYRDKDVARPGDVLIAMTDLTQQGDVLGSPLMVPRAVGDYCLFTLDAGKVEPSKGLDAQYLYYTLRSKDFRRFAAAHATGTTVRRVRTADVLSYEFPLPPIEEQRAITRVLGALDDKVELNRRMSKTLEEMARARFQAWFVDFDPVHAKAEGRSSGLPPDLDALFPESFEASELGEIPAGWDVRTLGDAFRITMGQSPPGKTYNQDGDGLPFYQGRTDFGFRFPSRRVYCTAPTRLAEPGDSLVSVRAPVGDVNMAMEPCSVGRGVAAVRHQSGSRSYTYYSMQSLRDTFERFEAEGTVFGSVNKKDFHGMPWISPPQALVAQFEKSCSVLDGRLETNERATASLSAQRDALLPQLLSGELRVALPLDTRREG